MLRSLALWSLVVLVGLGSLAPIADGQDDERQAVRRVIEDFTSAYNDADLSMLLAHIAEDAVIDSRLARGKVTKQEYAEALARAFKTRQVIGLEIRDIRVTMVDATHATARSRIYPMTLGRRYVYDHDWVLEKRDGRWLIVGTVYRTKAPEPVKPLEIA